MTTIFSPITIKNFDRRSSVVPVMVIRISGDKSLEALKSLGVNNNNPSPRKAIFTKIYYQKEVLDEALYTFFPAPHSFTGENVVELAIHGSSYILEKITEIFNKIEGLRFAEPGEFSKRAFLNGKITITQAEAIDDIIRSENYHQHKMAFGQMSGQMDQKYALWREKLLQICALIEASIDFSDQDIPDSILKSANQTIENLLKEWGSHLSSNVGEKIRDGFSMTIMGKVNSGKSSLMNHFASRKVSIVSHHEGTTRDIISTELDFGGINVRCHDTAGLRDTDNEIEKEGIEMAKELAENVDLKLWLIDSSELQQGVLTPCQKDPNTITIINKIDLLTPEALSSLPKNDQTFLISAKVGTGIPELSSHIYNYFDQKIDFAELPAITRMRHRIILQKCHDKLSQINLGDEIEFICEDIRIIANDISKLSGRSIAVDDILGKIFSEFCIGK